MNLYSTITGQYRPLKPEDAKWLESIGLIFRESGQGDDATYMTTGDPKALADDDISFIEGVLYARHFMKP